MPKIDYRPTPFDQTHYAAEVQTEIESDRGLNALFLIHGYIDAYLRDWLFVTGTMHRNSFSRKLVEEFERISFRNVLLIHLSLGNISEGIFQQCSQLNQARNDFAHRLIKIDLKSRSSKAILKKYVTLGLRVCKEIKQSYRHALDEKQKQIAV